MSAPWVKGGQPQPALGNRSAFLNANNNAQSGANRRGPAPPAPPPKAPAGKPQQTALPPPASEMKDTEKEQPESENPVAAEVAPHAPEQVPLSPPPMPDEALTNKDQDQPPEKKDEKDEDEDEDEDAEPKLSRQGQERRMSQLTVELQSSSPPISPGDLQRHISHLQQHQEGDGESSDEIDKEVNDTIASAIKESHAATKKGSESDDALNKTISSGSTGSRLFGPRASLLSSTISGTGLLGKRASLSSSGLLDPFSSKPPFDQDIFITEQVKRYFVEPTDAGGSSTLSTRSRRILRDSLEECQTLKDVRLAYEKRIEDVERELEREQQSRIKIEKQCDLMAKEGEELVAKIEDADAVVQSQVETNRKREFELAKIRKELDEQQATYEGQMQQVKKKQQEQIAELSDQLDQSQRNKLKLDRENKELLRQLEEMTTNFEKADKRRQVVEKQVKTFETQINELSSQLQEAMHSLSEHKVGRSKVAQDNSDLVKRKTELETQVAQLTKNQKSLMAQLEEATSQNEEASRLRSKVQQDLRATLGDIEQLRTQCDEAEAAKSELDKQVKRLNNELADVKARLAASDSAKNEEVEDMKRKLQSRIYDAEQQAENLSAKLLTSERAKSKLQTEIDETMADNDRLNQAVQSFDKRQKANERIQIELQARIQQMQMDYDQSITDTKMAAGEVIRLRNELEDQKLIVESLRKENKNLTDEVRDLVEQHRQSEWTSVEREKARKALEGEKEELIARIDEMDGLYRSERAKIDRVQSDFNQLREDFDRRLMEREEEFESARKTMQVALEAAQSNAENESRNRMEAMRLRKKAEEVVNELEARLQQALMACNESDKIAKRFQQQLAEQQGNMAAALGERDHLRQQLLGYEKRVTSIANEVTELNVQLGQMSKAKKQGDLELAEANEHIQQLQAQNGALAAQKRRVEGEFQGLRDEYETAIHDMQAADEKMRRVQADWASAADEINKSKLAAENADQVRKKLEAQLRDTLGRIAELESTGLNRVDKRATAALEQRCREYEAALTEEAKRHADTQRAAKRSDMKIRDMTAQMEEDKRSQDRLKEVVERVQQKMKLYKKQLEETEENGVIQMNKFRKLQQELQEAEQRAESSESMLAKMRLRGRTPVLQGGPPIRSMSPTAVNYDDTGLAPAPITRVRHSSGSSAVGGLTALGEISTPPPPSVAPAATTNLAGPQDSSNTAASVGELTPAPANNPPSN